MIKSMTGFGSTDLAVGAFHHRIELRSVNSKFCDIKVKTPPDMNGLEQHIMAKIRERLARGRVDLLVYREAAEMDVPRAVTVNWDLLDQYFKAYRSIREKYGVNQDINLNNMINAREVVTLQRQAGDLESMWKSLEPGIDTVLDSLIDMRENEGRLLAVDMAGRLDIIKKIVGKLAVLAPEMVEIYKKRLEERIAALLPQGGVDETRLAQEVLFFADRTDITEEIIRLKSHIQQFLTFLDIVEPVGRKLDFLIQGMNREINTIGSKSSSAEISQMVVEVKSELEKLREQIQNVE